MSRVRFFGRRGSGPRAEGRGLRAKGQEERERRKILNRKDAKDAKEEALGLGHFSIAG